MTNEVKWSIDQFHSEIVFSVNHLMVGQIKGKFKIFEASIYSIGKDFETAEIDLWIDASSITTGEPKRDELLTGGDFLDAKNHKQIIFTSGTIRKINSDGDYELSGELTMKGITKNIKLNVHFEGISNDPSGDEKAKFAVTGKLNRSDWRLVGNKFNETGSLLVADELNIACEIELINEGQKELTMEMEPTSEKENV